MSTSIASAILGEDVILHHTKLFQKPPEKGSPFPMHQDWTYFPSRRDTMVAGIIHVSDATDEMERTLGIAGMEPLRFTP